LNTVFTRLPVKLGLLQTRRWTAVDYGSLVRSVAGWCLRGFSCAQGMTVADLCTTATRRVMADLWEPLCLSALNTAPSEACGRVFLRVLQDSFWRRGGRRYKGRRYKSSDMLIPKVDLSSLFPHRAALWLHSQGADVQLGVRIVDLPSVQNQFDHVVIATPPWEAARLLRGLAPAWAASVDALDYRAIATVYAQAPADFDLASPLRALASDADNPAQFVFQRREANPSCQGLLAFVVSDAQLDRAALERLVLIQGEAALGVALRPVTTIVEKRATFACTAHMTRPAKLALAGLSVVGDYVQGPYPATIEGAVLSASQIKSD
jgi:hydroxysqualene dehydroxylase